MSAKSQQIAEMVDMLPASEQDFALEFIKRLVLAWDPDFTKLTPAERAQLEAAEAEESIPADQIDWDNLDKMDL